MWSGWSWWWHAITLSSSGGALDPTALHPPTLAPSQAAHAPAGAGVQTLAPHPEQTPVAPSRKPKPPGPIVRLELRDEDVLRALQQRQPNFLSCYRRAARVDPSLASAKITLHVHVGLDGLVSDAHTDGGNPALVTCALAVARSLTFPLPEVAVDATLPLLFVAPR